MNHWYQEKGIAFLLNPSHGSHPNLCEKTNQTMTQMLKP
ncbi:hypothetical protein Pcac1_g23938 [Phytophthora cactorum]|nr:hypothetical protein Pcac1_g23938 [Phytophthora cactorum]